MTASPITPALLLAAHADPTGVARYAAPLAAAATRRGILSANGTVAALAMGLNESGGLKAVQEDMYYTDAAYCANIFRTAFGGRASAAVPYLRNPQKLGDYVYAKLGGYASRGLGLGQLTGTANHNAYATAIGMTPAAAIAYMLTPEGAADSLCWYYATRGCAAPAEAGNLLRVRQIWAGSNSVAPVGWLDPHDPSKPGPVQTWAAQVRAAMGGAVVPAHTLPSGARVPAQVIPSADEDVAFPD